jgi:hypothetical protein
MNKFAYHNSIIYYHSELGWLVSWLIIDGQEILYCDETSLTSSSIRWGIPTMLPNPGVGDWVLPRHGVARTAQFIVSPCLPWKGEVPKAEGFGKLWKTREFWNNLTLTLDRNQSSIKQEQYSLFPHDFVYNLSYELVDHGCITTQQVTSPSPIGTSVPLEGRGLGWGLPIWFGLHPYFPTPISIQQILWWVVQDLIIDHHNDDTQVLKNPWTIILTYPTYQLMIEYSDVYPRVWIWTPPWHDAICIEPVTHDVGEYFINPIIIQAWESIIGTMKFEIETLE